MAGPERKVNRRGFVGGGVRVVGALGLGGLAVVFARRRGRRKDYVWQTDPDKCMACGNCQTHCVLDVSAVKAVQCFALCACCDVCTGYFPTQSFVLDTGAENQLCPTGAIHRELIEVQQGERYFEYTIDESLCIACGKCVEGCALMNGSLYLQVRHDRCLDCNECSIAVACPTEAFRRVPRSAPNLLKKKAQEAIRALERKRQRDARAAGTQDPPERRARNA